MSLDLTQIVISAMGLVGVLDLSRLVFFKSSKRKENAGAGKAEAEADSAAVAAMKDAIAEVRQSNDNFQQIHSRDAQALAEKDGQIQTLNAKILELTADNATLKMLVCKHDGCPFREPVKGRGGEWWEAQKHSDSLTDVDSIVQIAKKKGYSVKRLPSNVNSKVKDS